MNKRNGFTLVELLAVIVILAIILIIAVPGVLSIINKTKNSAYDRQVDMIKEAARNYITANAITWNGENPKSTLVTLDMLQSSGYLDKKVFDPRDKKELLCANVLVTKDSKNKISYDIDMSCNEVQPIHPRIGSGMIPIVWNGSTWVKADSSNKNFAWFNYGNQQWANVATVTEDVRQSLLDAEPGTEVPMDKINAMFVWIPRYKYKLWNVDGKVGPIGNANMVEDYEIDIQFEGKETPKSTGTKNGEWLTHPAFTFGDQEVSGLWIAKFETGYAGATSKVDAQQNTVEPTKVQIKPNTYAWNKIDIANMYHTAKGIKDTTLFGITNMEDPHMMKNIEWGATVYLTHSSYGKVGNRNYSGAEKLLNFNNNESNLTGCGAGSDATLIEECNSYETKYGQAASTTGNITGIYDTFGGAIEYVMGVRTKVDNVNLEASLSNFSQEELNQLGQDGKYVDVYNYNTDWYDYSNAHLGDATLELGYKDVLNQGIRINAWNGIGRFVYGPSTLSWFPRDYIGYNLKYASNYFYGPMSFDCGNGKPFDPATYRIVTM